MRRFWEAEHFMNFEGADRFSRFFLRLHGRPECTIERQMGFIEVGWSTTPKD